MLDVYVAKQLVDVLDQPDAYMFVFNYLPDAPSALPEINSQGPLSA